ncbi:MAG: radical SAM protein [Myxococcales bacterium]|nr:radical SAM protein [Myxococcales bacterium]
MSARTLGPDDLSTPRPIYVVWETTLRCDHACAHCGSRAGPAARPDELSTAELLEVADALIRLGSREVTLIGGEAYLRGDCAELIQHLRRGGVRVTMQTGGRGLTPTRVRRLVDAGLAAVGVSVDGLEESHDLLRDAPGSWRSAMAAIANAREVGLTVTSNSQINRLNKDELRETAAALREAGVAVWRAQLTAPMGRAADRPEMLLEPYMILEVIDTLAEIQRWALAEAAREGLDPARAFHVRLGNNVGYYGPHELLLRSRPGSVESHWQGCSAGKFVMGIESDGTIKGCPSLPTGPYTGGNVRDAVLEDIWEEADAITFARTRGVSELWGFCKECYYAEVCRGGCSFTAHSALGRRGNNPFCYYRANKLKRQGLRERLVKRVAAPGEPYDFGRFEIEVEPWSDEAPTPAASRGPRRLPVIA